VLLLLQILELKEAAACRARSMALAAARQLHDFMSQLNGNYQLGQFLAGQAALSPAAHPGPGAGAAAGSRGPLHAGAGPSGSPARPRGLHLHPVPPREREVQQQQHLQLGPQLGQEKAAALGGPAHGTPLHPSPAAAAPLSGCSNASIAPERESQGPSPAEQSQG
jgi:hypothetical protein